jgi:hypothetical protein
MRDLYELEVRVQTAAEMDDDHDEITVAGITSLWWADPTTHPFGAVGQSEVETAQRHLAGILGRLAVTALPWIDAGRLEHGCRPYFYEAVDGPSIQGTCVIDSWAITDPMVNDPPTLLLYVPPGQLKVWLPRVEGWLADIARADQ